MDGTQGRCRIVWQGGEGRVEEKRSVFLASVCPTETEEEALAFIESKRKEHRDARHNCFAYVLLGAAPVLRSSDDGEPQGTAGHPMLDVLTGAGLWNVTAVVTRYFGGVLLGTGGLVRAYSQAVQEALKNCVTAERVAGRQLSVGVDYTGFGKLQYFLRQRGVTVTNTAYGEGVTATLVVPEAEAGALLSAITELTAGRAVTADLGPVRYVLTDSGQVIL